VLATHPFRSNPINPSNPYLLELVDGHVVGEADGVGVPRSIVEKRLDQHAALAGHLRQLRHHRRQARLLRRRQRAPAHLVARLVEQLGGFQCDTQIGVFLEALRVGVVKIWGIRA